MTLNPSLDRTLWVDRLEPGSLHRVALSREHPSGKGVNVSLALHAWGEPTRVCAVVGGRTGERIRQALDRAGIPHDLVTCDGETRTNTKVIERISGRLTEFNEPGPRVAPEIADQVMEAVARGRKEASYVALSGSLPPGVDPDCYKAMIERLKRGGPVALDASGPALKEGIKAGPDLVKPNVEELESLAGKELPRLEDRLWALQRVHEMGVRMVALSMGPDGALFSDGRRVAWAKSEPVDVKSPVGCGDVLLAGLLFALKRSWDWSACARFAVAAATAAAMQEGTEPPPFSEVQAALDIVTVREGGWENGLKIDWVTARRDRAPGA